MWALALSYFTSPDFCTEAIHAARLPRIIEPLCKDHRDKRAGEVDPDALAIRVSAAGRISRRRCKKDRPGLSDWGKLTRTCFVKHALDQNRPQLVCQL
jgi:hypothetical protein